MPASPSEVATDRFVAQLEEEFEAAKSYKPNEADWFAGRWSGFNKPGRSRNRAPQRAHRDRAKLFDSLGRTLTTVPDDLTRSTRRWPACSMPSARCSRRHRVRLGDRARRWPSAAAVRRLRRAPVGPGFGARHVQPAPRGLGRPDRRAQATCRSHRAARQVRSADSPLSEYGVLGFEYGYAMRRPQDAGAVGSAVRRFRQRRADHDRSVHRRRRSQVAARQRPRAAAAARLRRPGAGTLSRPGSNASCSCARRTTSRSATSPRRRTTSTFCAARCTARSASR
jgi:hypothetical protein